MWPGLLQQLAPAPAHQHQEHQEHEQQHASLPPLPPPSASQLPRPPPSQPYSGRGHSPASYDAAGSVGSLSHYSTTSNNAGAGIVVEQALLVERLKAQAQWHEAEHHRAGEQNNRLEREAEAAREETVRLQTMVTHHAQALADMQKKNATTALEEKEARERKRAELENALAQERGRAERLAQEKARLGLQLQARENELASLTNETREVKQALAEAQTNARQLREERRVQKAAPTVLLPEQLQQTTKRAQHTRRALHSIFANLEGALEQFRRHKTLDDLNKRLVEVSVAVGTSSLGATKSSEVSAGWEALAQDLRRLLGNVTDLCPRLLDEVQAGKRESEVLSTELEELMAKLGTTSAAPSVLVEKARTKLQYVEHVADETAHLLRGMARCHLQTVRGQLRTTEAQHSDLILEAQECKRQAARRAAEAAEALQVRMRAEEERAEAQTAMELALVQRDTLELTVAAQERELEERQGKLDFLNHEVTLLREEGEHLRGALAQAHEEQARMEHSLATQEQALQQANVGLTKTREENERLLDRVQEAEAAVEATGFREADALERLDAATEEVQLYATRLADEEARFSRLEDSMVAYISKLQSKHQTSVGWHTWRHETSMVKMGKLQAALDETEARLTTASSNHETAEAKWKVEVATGERLAEACALQLCRRRQDDKARAMLWAWRFRARELARSRRDLHNYLKQFVLRRRVAAAHEVARVLEGRIQDFSQALEETIVEKKTESETAQLELAEARAQGLAKDDRLQTLQKEIEALRGRATVEDSLEEQLVAREREVIELRKTLANLEDLKREMDAEERRVQAEQNDFVVENEGDDGGEDNQRGNSAEAGSPTRRGGSASSTMRAYLVVRARRAEREKEQMAQQLAEAREDVRCLSQELEEMVVTMAALSPAGKEVREHAQALLTQQLERAHETMTALEAQLEETQQEASDMELQLVEALEDVSTLEEQLATQMESAALDQNELERLREAAATREGRLLSLSQRIGALEMERKEAHTRFVEVLGEKQEQVCGDEAATNDKEQQQEQQPSSRFAPLLVEEVGRLQQALEVSEQDRLSLEKQLADVLREREELFELCHLLRVELQATATAATSTTTRGHMHADTASSIPFFQSQQEAALSPRTQQQQRETAAQSAQDLHRAVQRSQERLDALLHEGNQVTEGLAAAVASKKKKGGGHSHHSHHHHHRQRWEGVQPPRSTSSSSGKEEERKKRKKSKKDKKKGHHHSRHRHQQIEEEEEVEGGLLGDKAARQELRALIQSTQEEVDAAAGKRQSVNQALVDYLNSLKASLRCMEGGKKQVRGKEEEEGDVRLDAE